MQGKKLKALRAQLGSLEAANTKQAVDNSALGATVTRQSEENSGLKAEVERLLPYAGVADTDAEAKRLVEAANAEAKRLIAQATKHSQDAEVALTAAKADAEGIIKVAAQTARQMLLDAEASAANSVMSSRTTAEETLRAAKAQADELVTTANRRAARLVEEAEIKAHEVAGEAMRAVREAQQLEGTVAALKNKIEGYGRDYLIPGVTLLDQLAEEYDFSKASQDLKFVKGQVEEAIRTNKAATCDYVEQVRRETAIRFVIDAFNGKVETALSRLRHDNYGKLKQEITDAYRLVNANGRPFRDARITQAYLDLRLEELRLGVVLQEMKVADVAEQKRIKDQIREEQRAQKEFQRALREAAKEQESIAKAQEKVRALYEAASDEQKQKYESQLQELAQKLAEAEAKNQRALSMAQQNKSGHVYVISNVGSFGEDIFKIGMTRRLEPFDRIRELGDASVPFEFDVHAMIFTEDAPSLERSLHKRFALFQVNKVNNKKEFFRTSILDL